MTDLAEWHDVQINSLRGCFPTERKFDETCPFAGHERQPNLFTLQYYKESEQEQHGRDPQSEAIETRGLEISYEPNWGVE